MERILPFLAQVAKVVLEIPYFSMTSLGGRYLFEDDEAASCFLKKKEKKKKKRKKFNFSILNFLFNIQNKRTSIIDKSHESELDDK